MKGGLPKYPALYTKVVLPIESFLHCHYAVIGCVSPGLLAL